jgi:hypothetical protein
MVARVPTVKVRREGVDEGKGLYRTEEVQRR